MTDEIEAPEGSDSVAPRRRTLTPKVVILLVVVALFGGLAAAKLLPATSKSDATGGASLTSVHNDAVADYEAALKTGKPIYVLFHSLS